MRVRTINPWEWQEQYGFVQGNLLQGSQRMLFCAGQTAVDEAGHPVCPGDLAGQIHAALDNLERVLAGADMTLSQVRSMRYYTTDVPAFAAAEPGLKQRLQAAGCHPTATLIGVTRLAFEPLLVEIEATAVA